jgi:hypothetical protein
LSEIATDKASAARIRRTVMRTRPVQVGIGIWLIVTLTGIFFPASPEAAAPPQRDARARLDALLAEYRRHGLPLPPANARLVRYRSNGEGLFNGEVTPPQHSLAFLVPETAGPYFWNGGRRWPVAMTDPPLSRVPPTVESARAADSGDHETLFFALQCHARGWVALSADLLARSERHGAANTERLRREAWEYWAWRIPEPEGDWREIVRRLKALSAESEDFRQQHHRATIASLADALRPRKAKPGSVDALIGSLAANPAGKRGKAICEEIAGLGFEAVPALIDHLDDERMTRIVMQGFNNFRPWHQRVKHVAGNLVQQIASQKFGRDWLDRQKGYQISRPGAEEWWRAARLLGEEKYALGHALGADGAADEHQVAVLQKRYPRHLPKLYRKVLDDHPDIQAWSLAKAVAKSTLPMRDKLELLRYGAARKSLMHRREALYQLLDLDRPTFVRVVGETLQALPRDVEDSYWGSPEASFARLVALADEPSLWKTLQEAARRSCVGLRMELLNRLHVDKETPSFRIRRLRLLAAFLDDETVRDREADTKRYHGPCAGFCYHVISVRNCAAEMMAHDLGVAVPLKPTRTEAEWRTIRHAVRRALEREHMNWVCSREGKAEQR